MLSTARSTLCVGRRSESSSKIDPMFLPTLKPSLQAMSSASQLLSASNFCFVDSLARVYWAFGLPTSAVQQMIAPVWLSLPLGANELSEETVTQLVSGLTSDFELRWYSSPRSGLLAR